jgi:3-oxoacyl-(acyl-carrier-protein) synthase
MGKAVRLGVGAALSLIEQSGKTDGIIIGTANGGMEDCIKFLNQIIEYDEGMLTPTNFVQSTANAIAGQVGMMLRNTGYNITHVHRGLAFENALLDARMYLTENPGHKLLLGGVDEISAYNFNIDLLAGWFKPEDTSSKEMYTHHSPGSFAGEGSVMFYVDSIKRTNSVKVVDQLTTTTQNPELVKESFHSFLQKNKIHFGPADLYMSGENGDNRLSQFYDSCETLLGSDTPVIRFKHITGEYGTASSMALWIACHILRTQDVPLHMQKTAIKKQEFRRILIYNNHKGLQHSFILCSIDF